MAEQASRSARQKGKGKSEEGYGPGAGKGKARAPSQGRNKGKAQTKGGGKAMGHAQGQGSGKGSPPAPSAVQLDPLLEAAYQLYLQGRSHNQSRVSRNAWLRNNLRNNSEVRTQLRQRMEAAQGALRSERSAPSQPSGTGESASATPHRQPPTPPKAPPRDQQGRKLEPRHSNAEETEAARGGGPPSPTGDSYESSTEAVEEENPARPGTPTPWARRTARKTTAARSAALPAAQHVSQAPVAPEAWEPDAMEAGSLSPPLSEWEWPSTPQGHNQRDFASLSEVAAALPSVPLGGLEAAAMEVDPEPSPAHGGCKTPPANPASPECSPSGHQPDGSTNAEVVATTPQTAQPSSPQAGPGPQASSAAAAQDPVQDATPPRVLSPTSPAEPAKEGGGATTPSVEGGIPPATAPAVPVPEGEPRLLRLDVSCQVGTHLVVLRMATTANSTISSLIAKARERASAPGLTVASLHGSPDVELPHAATLGAVLPQGELRLLLREGPSTAAPTGASLAQGAAPSLFSPDQCWCYCCGIGTGSPLLMQAHAMTDRHVWNARVFVRRHRAGEPGN